MSIKRKPLVAALAAGALAATLAGCGGGSGSGSSAGNKTIYYLTNRAAEHLDPQRTYIGRDIFNLQRLAYRGLVSFPVTKDESKSLTPQPDLATNTGTASNNSKTWKFTLKDGVKWQDGKAVTCADVKYGTERAFATDPLDGGPTYPKTLLDIPTKAGQPVYDGPYKKDGQAAFDKAVSCSGKTITYKFKAPFPDFPLSIAALTVWDPYRKDQDQAAKSNYSVFSDGPYKLQGKWNATTGGTFVRNKEWSQSSDSIRKPKVDKFTFVQGPSPEVIAGRLIADSGKDQYAVTDRNIPPSSFSRITGSVAARASKVNSPYVFYLLPNFNRMKNLKVRQALAESTDLQGYINAEGGSKAGIPAKSIVAPDLIGYKPNPDFTAPESGDPKAAAKLLKASGEKLPYPIKYTYQGGTPVSDKTAAALAAGWTKAGFKVTLDPQPTNYYTIVQKPTSDSDIYQGGWGADWPAIVTVLPQLFDSTINLSPTSNAQDYGAYRSNAVNKLFDQASQQTSVQAAATYYQQADEQLAKDVAYIPLDIEQFYFLRGSKVANYDLSPATSRFPDLGAISVK